MELAGIHPPGARENCSQRGGSQGHSSPKLRMERHQGNHGLLDVAVATMGSAAGTGQVATLQEPAMEKLQTLQETSWKGLYAAGVKCCGSQDGGTFLCNVSPAPPPDKAYLTAAAKGRPLRVQIHFHRAGKRGYIPKWQATPVGPVAQHPACTPQVLTCSCEHSLVSMTELSWRRILSGGTHVLQQDK